MAGLYARSSKISRASVARSDGAISKTSIAMLLTAESVNEQCRTGESQLSRDIFLNQWCRRRGKRHHRRGTQSGQVLAQHAIVETEIMAPLGDAVRFVNCDERRFPLSEHLGKTSYAQPLGRDEQKLQSAG